MLGWLPNMVIYRCDHLSFANGTNIWYEVVKINCTNCEVRNASIHWFVLNNLKHLADWLVWAISNPTRWVRGLLATNLSQWKIHLQVKMHWRYLAMNISVLGPLNSSLNCHMLAPMVLILRYKRVKTHICSLQNYITVNSISIDLEIGFLVINWKTPNRHKKGCSFI